MVRELVKGKKPDDYLFPDAVGSKVSGQALSRLFQGNTGAATGLAHLIPYVYRHTFATWWLRKGESVELLATLMGNTPAVIMHH